MKPSSSALLTVRILVMLIRGRYSVIVTPLYSRFAPQFSIRQVTLDNFEAMCLLKGGYEANTSRDRQHEVQRSSQGCQTDRSTLKSSTLRSVKVVY